MSDGPYKTLQMRPKWKALAECAYNGAYTLDEVSEAMGPALSSDWRSEVSASLLGALRKILIGDNQGSLFSDQATADVRALRAQCNSALDASLVDSALDVVAQGLAGRQALELAIESALESRLLSGFRQIEELSPKGRAADVRSRLETAFPSMSLSGLARAIVDGQRSPSVRSIGKRDGLDDGVSF